MVGEAARIVVLEEEIEGEQVGSDDFVFRRIGDSLPVFAEEFLFDLKSPPFKPLEICNRFGVLIIANSEGFLVVKTKDAIDLAKEVKEKGKGPCLNNSVLIDVKIGRVSLLEISRDSSIIATVINADIYFFSIPSLLKKDQKSVFSCSLSKSGVIKNFKWLNKDSKSYIVLSDNGILYRGNFKGELEDVFDSVDAVDCSPDGKSIAILKKKSWSIYSTNFEEILRMPLSFDSESIKMDSIGWVREDSIIIGTTQLNNDQEEEGYFIEVITTEEKSFLEESCKPVVFSFPYLFEGHSDYIIPSGFGPHLLLGYLDRWGVLLTSNRKNTDQHVVLLKWNLNEGKNEVNSLEFQNDKYIPRIDLKENGEDNTIVGFGVEKVSLFEKIVIQAGTDMQELAPQFIMVCLTCEGKLILYHIARASDLSELPQYDIPDFEALESKPNLSENDVLSVSKQSDDNNVELSVADLANLANTIKDEEELEVKNNNQVKIGGISQPMPSLTFTETKIPETKIPEPKIPETKIPNEANSPFISPFGTAPKSTLTETKAQTETTSFKSPFTSSNSPFNETKIEQSQTSQESQSSKGGFGFGSQNTPFGSSPFSLKPFGTVDSTQNEGSKPFGTDLTPQKEGVKLFGTDLSPQKEGTNPFGTDLSSQKEGLKPFGQSNISSETSSALKVQPFGFAQSSLKPFGTVDSTQKEGSKPFGTSNLTPQREESKPFGNSNLTPQKEESKPFGTSNLTPQKEESKPFGTSNLILQKEESKPFGTSNLTPQKEESKPFGTSNLILQKEESKPFGTSNITPKKEGFAPFSGPGLKLGSPMPSSEISGLNKTSENKISFNIPGDNSRGSVFALKNNADKKPGNFEEREVSNKREKLKGEKESEQDKFYSIKDITNDLERLLSAIEKEVGFTSQQNILLELDQNLKKLSELSLECNNNIEEQLEMVQDLSDKMSQVSSRQVYMESIVNQSSDKRYWEVWNSQKLPSEFEIKKQNILKANQNLTSHLVELERHFNSLEIKEFGESNRIGFNRRNKSQNPKPAQSLHSVYNTLNSQMATAEELSETLSKQISTLKITNSPSPPLSSKRAGSVKKLLFESIGLSYEQDDISYRSPEFNKSGIGSSSSVKSGKSKMVFESKKGSEIQSSSRRRRDSLDRSWSSVEPQKTTVKRIPSVEKQKPSSSSSSAQKRFSIGSDKKFKSDREIIQKEKEPSITHQSQTGRFSISISSPPKQSFNNPTQDFQVEKTQKKEPTSPPQQSSVFQWAREIPNSSQNSELKPQEPPKTSPYFQSPIQTNPSFAPKPFSNVFSTVKSSSDFDAKSQTGQTKIGENSFKPPVFNFSLSNTSNQSSDASSAKTVPSIFGKSNEQEAKTAKTTPSIFGKLNNEPEKTSTETVPTLSKTVPSFFQQSSTSTTTFGGLNLGTGSPEKPVPVSVPTTVSSPPKPVPTTLSFSPPKLTPTISSPPKPVPTISISPPKPVTEPTPPVQLTPPLSTPEKEEEDEMEEEQTNSLNFGSLAGFGSTQPTQNPKPDPFGPSLFNTTPSQTQTPQSLTPSPGSPFRPPSLSFPSSQQPSPPGTSSSTPFSSFGQSSQIGSTGFGQPAQINSTGFGQPAQINSTRFGQPAQVGSSTGFGQPAQINSTGFGQPAQINSAGFGQPAQVGSGGFGQPAQVGSSTGFGQAGQIGAGQPILGSVLGSFGQSRQFGAGFSSNSTVSGFGMSSTAPSSGGFAGMTGGGFAAAATGATSGGFAGAAATGATAGGFGVGTGGGFVAAATGATGGLGFGGTGTAGLGFGGFGGAGQSAGFGGSGGFGGVSSQGSGFSSFGGTGPGRPPAELLSQMRK